VTGHNVPKWDSSVPQAQAVALWAQDSRVQFRHNRDFEGKTEGNESTAKGLHT